MRILTGKKTSFYFSILLSILFLLKIFTNMGKSNLNMIIAVAGILCTIIPFVLKRIKKFNIDPYVIWGYLLFLFLSQYLGTLWNFYSLGWWDFALHIYSGMILGLVGHNMLEDLEEKTTFAKYRPSIIFWFLLSFGVFGGVLWEVFEFSMDTFFHTTTQGGGNFDTMTDLIADSLGALVVALFYYRRYFKKRKRV